MNFADPGGVPVGHATPVRRVVSLIPSLTESMASMHPERLVGATDWCIHPADLDVTRVGGPRTPDLEAILGLEPDLVVVNATENLTVDMERLRRAGLTVWVTHRPDVPTALASLERLFDDGLGWARPAWLVTARRLWSGDAPAPVARVVVPVWRDPWLVVGPATMTSDLLARVGLVNVVAPGPEDYPLMDLADIDGSGADVVLLPDDPYDFTVDDGPEAFTTTPTRLVNGRLLTWDGPSLVEAHAMLTALAAGLRSG